MYRINDRVVYLSKKVYIIARIDDLDFGDGNTRKYYILKSVRDADEEMCLPVDSEAAMKNIRPLLSKKEINAAIENSISNEIEWNQPYKERVQKYNELLKENNMSKILCVVKYLIRKKENSESNKKTLSNIDTIFLQDILRTIKEEFSYVLKISEDEVVPYILNKVNKSQKNA